MEIRQGKRAYNKKIDKDRLDIVLKDISLGAPQKHAAEANGVSERYFYYLIEQGVDDLDHGILDSLEAYLVQSLRKIQKQEIIECRENIKHSPKGHKGSEWTLEHVYWREFCGDARLMQIAQEIALEKRKSKDAK